MLKSRVENKKTLSKEQMKTTDTRELLTPPLSNTAASTAYTQTSSGICNILFDCSVNI